MASPRSLTDVEDGAARHVVVDDPIDEAIEIVTLPHELAADRVHLGARHPVGHRLLLDADEPRRQHQRREVDDGDVGDDAVVVVWITLGNRQRFAPALRRADVVTDARPGAIHALDEDHRRVVGLLHLQVAEVLDRLVHEGPFRRVFHRVAGVAPVCDDALCRPHRRATTSAKVGNHAVHPAATELRGAQRPGGGKGDAEIDGPGCGVDGRHRAVDRAERRCRVGRGRPLRLGQRDVRNRLADRGCRNRRAQLRGRAVRLSDRLALAEVGQRRRGHLRCALSADGTWEHGRQGNQDRGRRELRERGVHRNSIDTSAVAQPRAPAPASYRHAASAFRRTMLFAAAPSA